ncbi:MAG: hypothetical protein IH937_04345 [Acidobacteria bacterium]|nr:hypothetical protein [Acidobacteriota bacterium]
MIERTLKGIAVVLVLIMMTLLVVYLNRSDPWAQIPGKRITGEEATERMDDWSFMEPSTRVILEVRPSNPYSLYIRAYQHKGVLYLNSISPENRWTQFLLEDPNLRLKVKNKIYKVRATRVEDPALVNEIQEAREQMSPRLKERTPEERAQNWYFRVDSR